MYQIHCKLKASSEWEPVSIETQDPVTGERRFHYENYNQAREALDKFYSVLEGLPNLIVRMTGQIQDMRKTHDFRICKVAVNREDY